MTDVQVIFNKVIDAKHYPMDQETTRGSDFMCIALIYAYDTGTISGEEYRTGISAIKNYLGNFHYLNKKLRRLSLPYDIKACLLVYRHWSNRP